MGCQHKGCHCPEASVELEGMKFCSEKCAEAHNESASGPRCACGHPDCAAV